MFSEALRILDRNTVNYMIEELQKELKETKAVIEEKDAMIEEKDAMIEQLKKRLKDID